VSEQETRNGKRARWSKAPLLKTACRSPGGQPRKIAGRISCQKNAGELLAGKSRWQVFLAGKLWRASLPENRAGNLALAGKKSGEILCRKKSWS
jgi:hypothetical protein